MAAPSQERRRLTPVRLTQLKPGVRQRAANKAMKLEDRPAQRALIHLAATFPSDKVYWVDIAPSELRAMLVAPDKEE